MASLLLGPEGDSPETAPPPQESSHDALSDFFFAERILALALIVIVALWLRARDPNYTSAYMDESIYVVYGRMFLARHFEAPLDTPLHWSFGWYLWPILSATAARIGGIIAVRELSALMGTISVLAVYGFARRLFGYGVGVGSAALFAVAGPAVMVSRIATRDAGMLFFLAVGLWAFVEAWQSGRRRSWFFAALCLLCAFLCKYVVVIYLPLLCLIALRKGWRGAYAFCLPLTAALVGYLLYYWPDLRYLLLYGGSYGSLRATGAELWRVYVSSRIALWLIALLALPAFFLRERRTTSLLLWLGAIVSLAFQWETRADFDFWKHAVYPLIFLAPLAVRTILAASRRLGRRSLQAQTTLPIVGVLLLCFLSGWTGKSFAYDQVVFWPNVKPIVSFFEGRLSSHDRILMDDSVFRYYFHPPLGQSQMVDPFFFHYKEAEGGAAYTQAVNDAWFDYIVLDGGQGAEAKAMHRAIRGHLQAYTLLLQMPDPSLGQRIQIYQRTASLAAAAPPSGPRVEITHPTACSVVQRDAAVTGVAHGAAAGWYVRPAVFTDRWYGLRRVPLRPDGSFAFHAIFGGEGDQACHQILRVRLYDAHGDPRAVALEYNLKTRESHCR